MVKTNNDIKILCGGHSEHVKRYESKTIDGDPLWISRLTVTNPEALKKIQEDMLNVGVDFIRTFTYQSSIEGYMKQFGYTKEQSYAVMKGCATSLIQVWNDFSKKNKDAKKPHFCGSIGSYGAYLHDGSDYTGEYKDKVTKQLLREFHAPRFNALVEGGCDFIVFETIPCKIEAEVLVELLSEHPDKKGWVSFSCRDDGHSIASGENFQETAHFIYNLNSAQLVGIGVNCLQPLLVESLFKGINDNRKDNPIPLIVYPNSGEVYTKDQGYVGKETCKPVESFVPIWLDLGVKYIGCCCRTTIEDLQKIKVEVKKWQMEKENK